MRYTFSAVRKRNAAKLIRVIGDHFDANETQHYLKPSSVIRKLGRHREQRPAKELDDANGLRRSLRNVPANDGVNVI
jgi:hypothetical protein